MTSTKNLVVLVKYQVGEFQQVQSIATKVGAELMGGTNTLSIYSCDGAIGRFRALLTHCGFANQILIEKQMTKNLAVCGRKKYGIAHLRWYHSRDFSNQNKKQKQ